MSIAILIVLHLLASLIWVGGMFFAHVALRPTAAQVLQPPERLTLLCGVFKRFFLWVKGSILVLFITGFALISLMSGQAKLGGHVHAMLFIAVIMTLIFAYIYARPFKLLKVAVADKQWADGALALGQIRKLLSTNLVLGIVTVAIGAGGRYF
jgi:uncharacterized membrane protein